MTPIDTHDEPWLRDAARLAAGRRAAGAARRRRRRRTPRRRRPHRGEAPPDCHASRSPRSSSPSPYPSGLVLRAAPNASVTPPATSQSPTPAPTFTPPSLDAALVRTGWKVIGQPPVAQLHTLLGLPAPAVRRNGRRVRERHGLRSPPVGPWPVWPPARRSPARAIGGPPSPTASRPTSATRDRTVAGDGLIVPKGSLIVDRVYGSGTVVEVVVTPPWKNVRDTRTAVTATSVLTLEQSSGDPACDRRSVLAARIPVVDVRRPLRPERRLARGRDRRAPRVSDGARRRRRLPDGAVAVVNMGLVRDGVGSFVRVRLDSPTPGAVNPLEDGPCYLTNLGADCRVTQPWTTSTVDGSTVETSVQEVSYPENSAGWRYAGAYRSAPWSRCRADDAHDHLRQPRHRQQRTVGELDRPGTEHRGAREPRTHDAVPLRVPARRAGRALGLVGARPTRSGRLLQRCRSRRARPT